MHSRVEDIVPKETANLSQAQCNTTLPLDNQSTTDLYIHVIKVYIHVHKNEINLTKEISTFRTSSISVENDAKALVGKLELS